VREHGVVPADQKIPLRRFPFVRRLALAFLKATANARGLLIDGLEEGSTSLSRTCILLTIPIPRLSEDGVDGELRLQAKGSDRGRDDVLANSGLMKAGIQLAGALGVICGAEFSLGVLILTSIGPRLGTFSKTEIPLDQWEL